MSRLNTLIDDLRTAFGHPPIDPFDASAPRGTVERRIAAHNALMDVAKPGRDRICGASSGSVNDTPCVLRQDHAPALFDDRWSHMGVEQRDRARRYLVHSEPDPARRA